MQLRLPVANQPAVAELPPFLPPVGVSAAGPVMPPSLAQPTALPILSLPPLPPLPNSQAEPLEPQAVGSSSQSELVELRKVLRGDDPAAQWNGRRFNLEAIGAAAAASVGLVVLPFEMGLVSLALGAWCLRGKSSGGAGLAMTALIVGGLDVAFQLASVTFDFSLSF